MRGHDPPSHDFFEPPPSIKADAPHGVLPLKNKSPPLESKAPFQEMIPRKKTPKNWKLSLKQYWKKMTEIP